MSTEKRGKDFDRMIIEAVQGNFSFFAWISLAGIVEKCELKIKAFRKDYNEMELVPVTGQEDVVAKVISGNRKLNIYVPELSLSFTSELKNIGIDKKVKIYIPTEFSFYERRKHERLTPNKTCYMSFELNKNVYKKTIFDISLGGVAIVLPKSDKVNIVKGKEFPLIILDVLGRRINVKAECVGSVTIDRFKNENLPYGGFKLAFRFSGLSKEDRDYLLEFITLQAILQKEMKKAT
jgi:hypothetical protein